MKKTLLPALLLAVLLNACTFNKYEMAKVKHMAVPSITCQKPHNSMQMLIFNPKAADSSNYVYEELADSIKFKSNGTNDLFQGGKFMVIPSDSIVNNPGYNKIPISWPTQFAYITNPFIYLYTNKQSTYYKVSESFAMVPATPKKFSPLFYNRSTISQLKELYPNADAFAFITAWYFVENLASLGNSHGNLALAGVAKMGARYTISIYNKDGKQIMYYVTRQHWSKSTFSYDISQDFYQKAQAPLHEADSYAYRALEKHMRLKLRK